LTRRALRAADHLLVSRYFDYTQVTYHKTVVAFEVVLKDVVKTLLDRQLLDCSTTHISEKIRNEEFSQFDDHFLIAKLRAVLDELSADDVLRLKIQAILGRRAPKLVAASERIDHYERRQDHSNRVDQLKEKIIGWSRHFDIPSELWHPWSVSLTMTKIGSHIPLSLAEERGYEEDAQQTVRILTTDPDDPKCHSTPLVEHDFALMKTLSESRLYAIRLYVHLQGTDAQAREKRKEVERKIRADLPNFPFIMA
jgi:HD superfamily phosphohydrolase